MKPASEFPEHNLRLTKPPSMTDEECGDLLVHDTGEAFISKWEPTDEEREAIARGAPIYLWVIARGHPPVALQVETPFVAPTVQ